MKTNWLLIVALSLLSLPTIADDRTPTEIANAKAFVLDSVTLGMTEQEFLRLYPDAKPFASLTDVKTQTKGLHVNRTKNTSGIDAAFWNGRLLEFYAWYSVGRTNEMGGFMTLVDRMIDKFGKSDAASKGKTKIDGEDCLQLQWKINQEFFCELQVRPDLTYINITDTVAHTKRAQEQSKKADVGF